MATTKSSGGGFDEVSAAAGRSLSFNDFVSQAVEAATLATKRLPGGPHPIWIGIIIRPDFSAEAIPQQNKQR